MIGAIMLAAMLISLSACEKAKTVFKTDTVEARLIDAPKKTNYVERSFRSLNEEEAFAEKTAALAAIELLCGRTDNKEDMAVIAESAFIVDAEALEGHIRSMAAR